MNTTNVLVAIFHKDRKDNGNFEKLKKKFNDFEIYVPTVDFYGNKWKETKKHFFSNNYDSLFVICSDVSVVCGNIIDKIKEFSKNKHVGTYGFGTINNFTFNWLAYDNINLIKNVPFIEGYCVGVNKALLPFLDLENIYGYGLDVEAGYKSHINGLKCIIDSQVCINHQFGKSYDNKEATNEYRKYLLSNPDVQFFLNRLNIFHPALG